jgi:hypothetical protein
VDWGFVRLGFAVLGEENWRELAGEGADPVGKCAVQGAAGISGLLHRNIHFLI